MNAEIPPDSKQTDVAAAPINDATKPLTVASLDITNQTNTAADFSPPVSETLLADARDPRERRDRREQRPGHHHRDDGHPHPQRPQFQQQDMRFRRTMDPNQNQQNQIYQQRILAEQMRRRQQQQQFIPPNNFTQNPTFLRRQQQQQWQQPQWQQRQQFQNFGQFNNFSTPVNYRPACNQNQFNNFGSNCHTPYGNQWNTFPHQRRRSGPDVMDIVGTLGGLFIAGVALDQIGKQHKRDQRAAEVEARPGDPQINKPKDVKVAADTERSEPFTAKSRTGKDNWSEEHGALVERARNNRGETVIYGDGNVKSLSENPNFKTLGWQEYGIRHDRTENLLWRLRNGEGTFNKDNPPKNAVMMIGTNNIGRASTDDIVRGIMENHKELRTRLPNSNIVVVGVLPKGDDPTANTQIQEINRKVQEQLKDKPNTVFVDARSALMKDGQYIAEMWKPAHINLTEQGQNKLLEVINAKLKK